MLQALTGSRHESVKVTMLLGRHGGEKISRRRKKPDEKGRLYVNPYVNPYVNQYGNSYVNPYIYHYMNPSANRKSYRV